MVRAVKDGREVVRASKVPTLSAWIDPWLADVLAKVEDHRHGTLVRSALLTVMRRGGN